MLLEVSLHKIFIQIPCALMRMIKSHTLYRVIYKLPPPPPPPKKKLESK